MHIQKLSSYKISWLFIGLAILVIGLFLLANTGRTASHKPNGQAVQASPTGLSAAPVGGGQHVKTSTPEVTLAAPAGKQGTSTSTPNDSLAAPQGKNNHTIATPKGGSQIKTVFLIILENQSWSAIFENPSAPYINKVLLPQASFAQQYYNPQGLHPSEPNYLWLEAGTNFGIQNDNPPADNHQSTKDHLVTYLNLVGISWKAYEEGISGKDCPLVNAGLYTPRHNPTVFFDDVTGGNDPHSTYCMAHERPFSELAGDLQNGTAAHYNLITPDLCHDMHDDSSCGTPDVIKNGDTWLSKQVPLILNSPAYKKGGVLFITWDESQVDNLPSGMIVLSPFAKGGGYSNKLHYTHSSTLRTIQEIFGIQPFLGDAAKAEDLSDLFRVFP